MILKKLLPVCLISLGLAYGCKKSASDPVNNPGKDDDDCVQTNAIISGDTLTGQYIIVYKASAEQNRSIAVQDANQLNREMLERHQITGQSLKRSFEGRNTGFVARLSLAEVKRLAEDESIAAIEQDKIIALGSCFTVAAPRLVTWNINRVGYGDGIGKKPGSLIPGSILIILTLPLMLHLADLLSAAKLRPMTRMDMVRM